MPRLPFRKRKHKELSEAERNRRLLVSVIAQVALLVFLLLVGAIAVINLILGSSLFIPKSAEGVLDSVEEPPSYTWSSESIRRVDIAGQTQEQHAARSATIDLEENKFQNIVAGVLPLRALFISDGKYTIMMDESSAAAGAPGRIITDVCHGAPTIPAKLTRMPTAAEIKAASPKLVSDTETVFGRRAWRIDFDLTPEMIDKLLWLSFFEQATPEEMDWVMSDKELEKVRSGDYTVEFASAYVTRDDRRLAMIDTRFRIDEGSGWRVLAQLVPNEQERPLAATDLGEPSCE